MHFTFFTLMVLLSTTVFAQTEKAESFDLNQDGVKDRFEYSVNEKIVRTEEDRNGDGKIDFKTILNDKTYYKLEEQDTDYDGKIDRKKSFLVQAANKTKLIIELDKNADGTFEIKNESIVDDMQKQVAGCETVVSQKIKDLSQTALKAVSKTDKGLLPTGFGYKVDYECYQKWGDGFNQVIKDVAVNGLQCFMDLDKKHRVGKATTGALRNAFNLTQLMKNDGISVVCSEDKDYDWTATHAHASTKPEQKMESKNITHPFVSINPAYPDETIVDGLTDVAKLKGVLFHETLHNLGYVHDENIEFPYTCGACCFDDEAKPEVKEQACKICTGNYKNETDLNYVKDFVNFSQLTGQEKRGSAATKKFLKENPKNISGISILAYAESGVFNPIGTELSKIILSQSKPLTVEDQKYLADAQKYEMAEFKNTTVSSKALANSLYELYYNKSGVNAVATLEKNKVAIKQELAKLEKAGGNNKYIHEEMNGSLKTIMLDMWITNYPGDSEAGKATTDRAYQLFDYFFPEKK